MFGIKGVQPFKINVGRSARNIDCYHIYYWITGADIRNLLEILLSMIILY